MALADYQKLVDNLVRDQAGVLSTDDRDAAIQMAVLRYGADAVRQIVVDVTWVTAGYYGPMPAGWAEGCYLVEAEYPIGETPPAMIDLALYAEPTVQKLISPDSLAAGAAVRVTYAAPHQLVGGSSPADTIPQVHRLPVASYAAHLLCQQLAAYYSSDRDTSISADGSNTESRARNFAARAKEYRGAYYAGIGKADPQAGGGSAGQAGTSGSEPAASVSSWAGRGRTPLYTNGQLSGLGAP